MGLPVEESLNESHLVNILISPAGARMGAGAPMFEIFQEFCHSFAALCG